MATLRDLGLSQYEARVYQSLLSTGPTTAKELSQASDVPMGRIYDVLNDLENTDIIRSQNTSRPKKYVAVEPATALDRLLEEKRSSLEAELEQYQQAVDDLIDRLEAAEPTEPFWTVAVGPENTIDLFEERLNAATNDIKMVASTPAPQFDLDRLGDRIADALREAIDRDVTISVLVSPDILTAISDDVETRYRRLITTYDAFEARIAHEPTTSFTLIDQSEVCIEVPNPLAHDEAFAMIALTDPDFAANIYEEFQPRWAAAEPYP